MEKVFFPTSFSSFDNNLLNVLEVTPVVGDLVPLAELHLIVNGSISDPDDSIARRALKSIRAHQILQTIAGVFFVFKPDLLIKIQTASWIPRFMHTPECLRGRTGAIFLVIGGIIGVACMSKELNNLSKRKISRAQLSNPSLDVTSLRSDSTSSSTASESELLRLREAEETIAQLKRRD